MQIKQWFTIAALLLPAGFPAGSLAAENAPPASSVATTEAAPAEAATPVATPVVDEKATSILRRMSEFLAKQGQFRVHTSRSIDLVLDNGMKVQTDSSADVAVRRPNGIHVDRKGINFDQQLYFNGKDFTLYRSTGLFATTAAPSTIDEFIDRAIDRLGIVPPSADLLYADPYKVLTEDMTEAGYVGLTLIDGVRCHQLVFRNQNVDWQIWVEEGDRPLPRKMVVTARDTDQAPQFVVYLSNWDLKPQLADSEFTFAPPESAIRIGIANAEAFSAN